MNTRDSKRMSEHNTSTTDQFGHRVPSHDEMAFDDADDHTIDEIKASVSEIMERRDACNHDERTFYPENRVVGTPATMTCDDCCHSLNGDVARKARDAGLATTEYTNKALPAGEL